MRRSDREITSQEEIDEILREGKFIVIAMCRGNEPYIVTLSYGYDRDKKCIYMHTGKQGLKNDFIQENQRVCATIIHDKGYIQKECGHEYRTIVINGKISFVEQLEEKKRAMEILLNQLEDMPDIIRERSLKNDEIYNSVSILRLDTESLTGKKGR
jgi:nitroimidazol reductase NimA-like FMN-containing flavoprotein (pyridoxamine 5'-phosphate oxidase superfamily)